MTASTTDNGRDTLPGRSSDDWRTLLDQIETAVDALNGAHVPPGTAQHAVDRSFRTERNLWRWRRSVEAAWLNRYGSLAQVIEALAARDQIPESAVVAALVKTGALRPDWSKVDRYFIEHGIDVWQDNGKDTTNANEA